MNRNLAPLLPREDAREAALFFVVSALCFLAALGGLTARSAYAAADDWTSEVTGQITIRIHDGAEVAQNALTIVAETPGVARAHIISAEEADALLQPWIGAAGLPENLTLPRLIAIEADPDTDDIGAAIAASLDRAGISHRMDDHVAWSRDVKRATDSAGLLALAAVLLLMATTIAVVAFATHATLVARRDIVELLHLQGAKYSYISGLFEHRFLMLGVQAGTLGAFLAFGATAFILYIAKASEDRIWLLPQLSLSLADGLILGLTPLLAGLAAMVAARITVVRSLSDMV